jgi:hypothetical protein
VLETNWWLKWRGVKVLIKARPRSHARYMLGLHKSVWKGVKAEEYVRKERKAWAKEPSSRA